MAETETLVSLGDLERYLLAVALWDLDAAGTIHFHRNPSLRRGQFLIEVGDRAGEWPGLEGRLLAMLPEEGTSVWNLVMDHWVPADNSLPLNAVVVEALQEALTVGVIERPEAPDLIPGFFGHHTFPKVTDHPERLASLRSDFEGVAVRWSNARETGGIVKDLLADCNQVLYDARPSVRLAGY